MKLQQRIEEFLKRTGVPPTRLGRLALNDPSFVADLRNGRAVSEETDAKVRAWLDRQGRRR